MRRLIAALAAAVLVVGGLALTSGGGAQAVPVATAAAVGSISWTDCGDIDCGTIKVPRSYANPTAGVITLALTRKVHTAAPFRGVMLVNPGGPGGAGTPYARLGSAVPGTAADHYDWVGFDPRGVGDSVPSLHCIDGYFGADRPNFIPTSTALRHYWEVKTAKYAAACGNTAMRSLLPFLSTRSTVKDMEYIRAAYQAAAPALDKPALAKLNFYGFSYGTYLGQVYAAQYPSKVGRFVLDGVINPTTYWYKANLGQEIAFDRNLDKFFAWMAAHNSTFHIGTNPRAIRLGFEQLRRNLDRYPAANGNLGPNELTDALLSAAYYVYDWDDLGHAYASLVRYGSGWPMFGEYAAANLGDDNGYAMYLATQCTDAPAPSWSTQIRDAWGIHQDYPFIAWDNTWFNAPCRAWRAPAGSRIPVNGYAVTAKILLISETLDAATPYSGALKVRSLFPSSSLIAGVDGTTHSGSLSGVDCVDNRIAAYLADGTVPARQPGGHADLRCPKVPPPTVTPTRIADSGGMSDSLRAQLMEAQQPR